MLRNTLMLLGAALFLVSAPVSASEVVGLDDAMAALAGQTAENLKEYDNPVIAIHNFSNLDGTESDFGRFLAEELTTRLFLEGSFQVVERQRLSKIISEHKLFSEGIVDPASAKELGKLSGAEALMIGTITDLGGTVRINARLISTETGLVFAAAATNLTKTPAISSLMEKVQAALEPKVDSGDGAKNQSGVTPVAAPDSPQSHWTRHGFYFVNSSEVDVALKVYGPGLGTIYHGKGMPQVPAGTAVLVGLPGQGGYGVRVIRPGIDRNGFQYWTKWDFNIASRGTRPTFRLSPNGKVSREATDRR